RLWLLRRRQRLALGLRVDQVEQLPAVLVGVFLGLEGSAQVLDERLRHVDLRLTDLDVRELAELCGLPPPVGVILGLEQARAFVSSTSSRSRSSSSSST